MQSLGTSNDNLGVKSQVGSYNKKDKNITKISQINQPVLSEQGKPSSQQKSYRSRDLSRTKIGAGTSQGMSIPQTSSIDNLKQGNLRQIQCKSREGVKRAVHMNQATISVVNQPQDRTNKDLDTEGDERKVRRSHISKKANKFKDDARNSAMCY